MSLGREQLIAVLEQAGPDQQVRQLVKAVRRPSPRPAHLDERERLIAEVGPDIAALVVVEAYQGGLGG